MRYLLAALFLQVSCGTEPTYREISAPAPAPVPGNTSPTWSGDVQDLVQESCALAGCHAGAGFLRTGDAFKASSSLSRIQSGNMPLKTSANYGLFNDAKKRRLIDYLTGT